MPSAPSQVDQKLNWLKARNMKMMDLALEKVVAHQENPSQYPLPGSTKSIERALDRLFKTLSASKRKKTIESVNKTLKASSTERNRIYGDLAAINLKSAVSVVQQIKALPVPSNMKFTQADLDKLRRRRNAPASTKAKGRSRVAPAQVVEATELAFVVQSLTCEKTTDLHKDEVNIAGFATDNLGGEFEVAPFFIGKFKKGDTLPLGANGRLFNFKLTVGQFPKSFLAGFFIVEKDLIRNSDFVNGLISFCVIGAAAMMAITVTMLIVGLAGGPASGVLIIASFAAAILLGMTGSVLNKMLDEISPPATDVITFDAPVAPGVPFDRTFNFLFGNLKDGKYSAAVQWITA